MEYQKSTCCPLVESLLGQLNRSYLYGVSPAYKNRKHILTDVAAKELRSMIFKNKEIITKLQSNICYG